MHSDSDISIYTKADDIDSIHLIVDKTNIIQILESLYNLAICTDINIEMLYVKDSVMFKDITLFSNAVDLILKSLNNGKTYTISIYIGDEFILDKLNKRVIIKNKIDLNLFNKDINIKLPVKLYYNISNIKH